MRYNCVYLALLEANIGTTIILEAIKDYNNGLASRFRDLQNILRFLFLILTQKLRHSLVFIFRQEKGFLISHAT
jgi:hypothetical protein